MFAERLADLGYKSGSVYATGVLKARDVIRMAADFRAQETISVMTKRILSENGVSVNEEIATAGHDDYLGKNVLETNCAFSIPLMSSEDKGALVNAT